MSSRRRRGLPPALGAAALCALALAAPASATFHLMQIREVYPGSAAGAESEYVELQMWATGQNLVGGHILRTYGPTGTVTGTSSFPADVSNAANQSTMVLATPQAEAQFGIAADAALASPGALDPKGGAVCWESIDCVSWGDFSGTVPSPAGTPADASGIPDGMALRRSIARGCATLLEPVDDTDNSAADFDTVFPTPRPNSVPPGERGCAAGGGGAAGSPTGQQGGAPQTRLRRKPPKRSRDRTPTFRFAADEVGARFECAVDQRRFRRCRSPLTVKTLSPGRHRFRVRARDASGRADSSPASFSFVVLPPKRR